MCCTFYRYLVIMNLSVQTIRSMHTAIQSSMRIYSYFYLGLLATVLYCFAAAPYPPHATHFVILADALLHGHLFIASPDNLTEVIRWQKHFYIVFPPMPALLLIPLLPFLGLASQTVLSILLAIANTLLSYAFFRKLLQNKKNALWVSILYAFGTIQWYHAATAASWYVAHIAAMFFVWLMLLEAVTKKRLVVLGFLIGCAYLCRLPVIFAAIFVILSMRERFFPVRSLHVKSFLFLFLGLFPALLINALYNYLRFGTIVDVGYTLLPIQHEFWYRYGFLSIKYVPIHLAELFTSLPIFIPKPPFVIPSLYVMAIWFTTPALFYAFRAPLKNKLTQASIGATIAIAIPSLVHGNNGFTQFGFRYAMDYLPFLLILTALGFPNKPSAWKVSLVIASIIVNAWGIIMIRFLNIWGLL